MASKKKGGASKQELNELSAQLSSSGRNIRQELGELDGYMAEFQKGNGTVAYWSGQRAYAWIKSVLTNMDHDEEKAEKLSEASGAIDALAKKAKNL